MIAWKIMHQKTATSFCLRKMLGAALSTCYHHWSPFLTDFLAFWIQHQWSVFYCEHKSTPRDVLFEIGSRAENISGGKLALSVVEGAIFNQLKFNYWWNALYSFDSWKVNPIARFVNICICQMSHHMVSMWMDPDTAHSPKCHSIVFNSMDKWHCFIPHLLNCENLIGFKLERHLFVIFAAWFSFVWLQRTSADWWNSCTKGCNALSWRVNQSEYRL